MHTSRQSSNGVHRITRPGRFVETSEEDRPESGQAYLVNRIELKKRRQTVLLTSWLLITDPQPKV